MTIFIISFCIIFMAMLAMGIGLFFGKAGITGTCSGSGKMIQGERSCEVCSKKKVNSE